MFSKLNIFLKKLFRLITKHKIKSIIILIVLAIVIFSIFKGPKAAERDILVVVPTTVLQEVDITGRVESSQALDLAVQSGGKVSAVRVKEGEHVYRGQLLMQVNIADLLVRLEMQENSLRQAQLALRKEEVKNIASNDISISQDKAFNTIIDTFNDVPTIINSVDIIFTHSYLAANTINSKYGSRGRELRDLARASFYNANDHYKDSFSVYKNMDRSSSFEDIKEMVADTYDLTQKTSQAVKDLKTLVDFINTREDVPIEDLIEDQKTLSNFIGSTNAHLDNLILARNNLTNAIYGVGDEDYKLEGLRSDVQRSELNIKETRVSIAERTIYAPIDGVITKVNTKIGETIGSGMVAVSIMSDSLYQVSASVPESDLAKISLDSEVEITLDAYGDDVIFPAKIISINPSADLVDGISTYKTIIQFTEVNDMIKSGMTADILIKGESKTDVLAVPQRAIITKDGKRFVEIIVGDAVEEKEVVTGMRGTNGLIEIISGLNEGDNVVVFTKK